MTYGSVFAPNLFAGQVVIVTGGGSGIGRCVAHELASLGAQVALVGRKVEKLQKVADEITEDGGRVSFHVCDIRQEEVVKQTVAAIVATHGPVSGLVNNAGGQFMTPLEAISAKGWEAVVNTNLTGGFLMARECYLQSMNKHGGSIVNIVAEWAARGVRVNAVAPGYIASSGMDNYPVEMAPMIREMAKTIPAGRFGTEAEAAAGIVFLLSPAASFISGTTLRIDGARPQARAGYPMRVPDAVAQARDAVKPFNGFHRAHTPKVFQV
jgi:citronellol/citronellal dehydrogenase